MGSSPIVSTAKVLVRALPAARASRRIGTVPTAEGHKGSYPRMNDTPVTYDGPVNTLAAADFTPCMLRHGHRRSGLETQMAPRPLAMTSHLAKEDAG